MECSWQMKSEVCLPPNQHDVIQPFIAANKTKETKNKNNGRSKKNT
jgi:hypothetical protein